ncbi:MAG TPA: carboxypeptidase regulatory-like domain-containing protein [Pyrinomonadaceae bacterium]|nr:carboxypeptidase regulatory-like domain-containing protein [Pyrinomonadaceae bacterium]
MNKINPLQNAAFREAIPRKSFILKAGIVLLFIMSLLNVVSAQTATSGQITGNVTDQSGAAVPDATITVTRVETGETRTVTTSDDGNYTLPNLSIGMYRVSVTKSGFKETAVGSVVVNVANITRQDIALEVGEISQTVEITADQIQVQTETGTVGEVVTGEQVRELPLNGRNFVQLTQLQPGVAAANNQDSKSKGLFGGVDFSVNGNSAQSNLFLTDGANNNDTGSNRTILLFPSIEAIAEFKTLRNSYGPEYGQAAGAVISIVTRGGSNEFHGSAFYFGRNDALNAAEFFAKTRGGVKDALKRHDYGFSLGGPIIKNRLFFFYSQEFNKEIRGQARFGSVPTLAERRGDFSQPRFTSGGAPCSGPAIGNNRPGSTNQIIPQASLSPAGLALLKLFPLPNVTDNSSCFNWSTSANSPINFREANVRIDYNLNENNKIFGRFTRDDWSNGYPILTGNLWGDDAFPAVESSWAQPSQQAAFKLTTTLSQTAINDIQFSYSANRINVNPGAGEDINREINQAIPGFYPDSVKVNGVNRPHPVFWGGIAPYNYGSGQDLWAQIPFRNSLDIYSLRDDASKVWGNHTFKAGFLYDTAAKNEDSGPNGETPQFWGGYQNSGNYLADILTRGSLFGFAETNTMPVGQTRYKNLEFYFGDTWKVRPNLTLELGARYSMLFEPYDERNLISSFAPELYNPARPATDPCNGLVVPKGTNPCAGIAGASTPGEFSNRSLRENNYKNLAPRLGIAWDVFSNGKTALRAGFGQFFLRERTSPVFGALTQNSPFAATIGGERTLDGPTPTFVNLGAASNGAPRFGFSPEAATPYSLQFNFSVGQQLWKDTVIEVGYVGNRARRQLTHSDINQVLPQNQLRAAFAPNANAVNALRPYSNYGSIYQFERNGRADYNSLQVLFRTRFTKNSQLQAAYTFSKSEADFGLNDSSGAASGFAVLDRNNRDLDFAESDINRPHIFVANMIYNLPRFNGYNSFAKTILGGWELAAIVQVASGTSLTPQINATGIQGRGLGQGFQAGITGTGTGVGNQRPLRVEGVPCTIESDGTRFINPDAFTLVGYKIGETIPKKTTCLGSPTKNVDFSVYKNFTPSWLRDSFLGESARLQFRLEFFNAFNTPQFNGGSIPLLFYNGNIACGNAPCSATNNTITGLVTASGAPTVPNGNFGQAGRTRGGREIQYAIRLNF